MQVEAVTKRFAKITAVDALSFAVRPGEIFALLGPNGAGKTTMVRMLMGILRPDSGSIRYHLSGDAALPERLGYLPEDRGLYPEVPVLRTLTYFGMLRGMARDDAARAAQRWLERLELGERAGDKLSALSKGNQQKVQFIASVLHRPALAVLDEPFSGLDPVNQDLFLGLVREQRETGTTILLSAHQMQLVERIADRVLLVNRGRQVLLGSLEEIRRRWAATERIIFRVKEMPDLGPWERHPAVDTVRSTGPGEFQVQLKAGHSLSHLLATAGAQLEISSIRAEPVSLHDIFVQAVGADERGSGEWSEG